jgi:hypothetical protein
MFGHMDALEGKEPHHKDSYPFGSSAHGAYLRGWNQTRGSADALLGREPMSKPEYHEKTGREDLHAHYMGSYADAADARDGRHGPIAGDSHVGAVPDDIWHEHGPGAGDRSGTYETASPAERYRYHHSGAALQGPPNFSREAASGLHQIEETVDPKTNEPDAASQDRLPPATMFPWTIDEGDGQSLPGPEVSAAALADAVLEGDAAALRKWADTFTAPHHTTDDLNPVANSAETTPHGSDGGAAAGARDGAKDRASGKRPTFSDASSHASPYVKAYSEAYSRPAPPAGTDMPYSLGGDSGQVMNSQQAQQSAQVALDSRTAEYSSGKAGARDLPGISWQQRGVLRLTASRIFTPAEALADRSFVKGYVTGRFWKAGAAVPPLASPAYESGLYCGITDNPQEQGRFVTAHREAAKAAPELMERVSGHQEFSYQQARKDPSVTVRGSYVQAASVPLCVHCGKPDHPDHAHESADGKPIREQYGDWQDRPDYQAWEGGGPRPEWLRQKTSATSTDLETMAPGTSADPMGSTPLNGPGTKPPHDGQGNPARSGGPSPYQGAPPFGKGPVAPDPVLGDEQEDMPTGGTMGAPQEPVMGGEGFSGYLNPSAYKGSPQGGPKRQAFRDKVQAGLVAAGMR